MKVLGIVRIDNIDNGHCELCGKNHNIKYLVKVDINGTIKYYGRECINKVTAKYYNFEKAVKAFKADEKKEQSNDINAEIAKHYGIISRCKAKLEHPERYDEKTIAIYTNSIAVNTEILKKLEKMC